MGLSSSVRKALSDPGTPANRLKVNTTCKQSSRTTGGFQSSSLQEERTRPQLGSGIRAENSTPSMENLTVPVGAAALPASKCCFANDTFTPSRFGHDLAHPEQRG